MDKTPQKPTHLSANPPPPKIQMGNIRQIQAKEPTLEVKGGANGPKPTTAENSVSVPLPPAPPPRKK